MCSKTCLNPNMTILIIVSTSQYNLFIKLVDTTKPISTHLVHGLRK